MWLETLSLLGLFYQAVLLQCYGQSTQFAFRLSFLFGAISYQIKGLLNDISYVSSNLPHLTVHVVLFADRPAEIVSNPFLVEK